MVGVSTGVTPESTVDDAERSDDVDDGVPVDLPQCFTTVVVVVATGLRSSDSVLLLRLLLLLAGENAGNLLALGRLTCRPNQNYIHSTIG